MLIVVLVAAGARKYLAETHPSQVRFVVCFGGMHSAPPVCFMQECVLSALHLCLWWRLLDVQSMLWCRAFSEPAPLTSSVY